MQLRTSKIMTYNHKVFCYKLCKTDLTLLTTKLRLPIK